MAFLFTNHLLLTTRASNGRLHLAKVSYILDTVCLDRAPHAHVLVWLHGGDINQQQPNRKLHVVLKFINVDCTQANVQCRNIGSDTSGSREGGLPSPLSPLFYENI